MKVDLDRIPTNTTSTHPGEVLLEEYLVPMGISRAQLANDLAMSELDLEELLAGRSRVDGATAVLLALRLGTSVDIWLNMQISHDISSLFLKRPELRSRLVAQLATLS